MSLIQNALRLLCVSAALAGSAAWAAAPADEAAIEPLSLPLAESGFSLRPPKTEAVTYQGKVNFDAAGGPGAPMLYPGYGGIAGLLAGIVTHGVLVEAGKNSEKTRLQNEADKVLEPYKVSLQGFTHQDLMQRSLQRLSLPGAGKLLASTDVGEGWIIESLPVFTMTQDRSALVLENVVSVYAAASPEAIRYRNVFRVVSHVHDRADIEAWWGTDQAQPLKEESAALFAHSLRLVLQDVSEAKKDAGVEKTIRYLEGKEQKMERASVVRQSCGRAVIKTLRGWVMSVPLRPASELPAVPECDKAERYPV